MKVHGKFQPTHRIKCFSSRARVEPVFAPEFEMQTARTLIPADANCSRHPFVVGGWMDSFFFFSPDGEETFEPTFRIDRFVPTSFPALSCGDDD